VPDVSGLSYADAVRKLTDAGFGKFKQAPSSSVPELKDRVVSTVPPANSTSAITNEITVVVGTGPQTKALPDVTNQTADGATTNLKILGFTAILTAPVASPRPAGEVVATDPIAGTVVPLDAPVTLKVSLGNQFVMPNLTGQFWVDAEPNLRALGWTGVLIKGANVDNSGLRSNAVVTQSPAPGSGVGYGDSITLSFAS
jgi:serine/threonine-protein kinase